jgi:hypothetical protein
MCSERAQAVRQQSHSFLKQMDEDEQWVELKSKVKTVRSSFLLSFFFYLFLYILPPSRRVPMLAWRGTACAQVLTHPLHLMCCAKNTSV